MKLFLVADIHFGVHPVHVDDWLDTTVEWFEDFLIPILEKYSRAGDRLIVLGDVYDNRSAINVKVINKSVKMFERLAKILPVDVIVGNHDMWAMNDPNIDSTVTIQNIDNVTVYHEPTIVFLDSKKALYLPWQTGKETLDFEYMQADLLFCHSDLQGCRTQVNPTRPINKHVPDITQFSGFKRVYSGHIHINQKIGNFTFVGAPYHMDRNDVGNDKGLYVYDTESDREKFIKNDVSPQYIPVHIDKESDIGKLTPELMGKHRIDLSLSSDFLIAHPKLRMEIDAMVSKYGVASMTIVKKDAELTVKTDGTEENFTLKKPNILEHINSAMAQTVYSDKPEINSSIVEDMKGIIGDALTIYEGSYGKIC